MNDLTVFENEQFGSVRTITRDGEPWFVTADVCRALEIVNHKDALTRLDDDEKSEVALTDPQGREQMTNIISVPGLYAIVLGSHKPEARAFKRWITHEVIPTIRKKSANATQDTLENVIADPEFGIRLLNALKDERAKREKLESALMIARPKAAYFDALVERKTLTGIRETAKDLQWREKDFILFLLDKGYVYRDQKQKLQPYAEHVADGLFVLKKCKGNRYGGSGTQLLITRKGREYFRLLHLVEINSGKTMIAERWSPPR